MTEHLGSQGFVASRFTRSVNVQQDLWTAESLTGYLVTAGVRRTLLLAAQAQHTRGPGLDAHGCPKGRSGTREA